MEVIIVVKQNPIISKDKAQDWILLGIPVLFIFGSLMHFIYEWSGNSAVIGVFAPTNESVWEHLKMTFWPILIWWITGYYILGKKHKISAVQWFIPCVTAEIICPLVIVSFFYTYTGAFGIESLILDIFSLLLGLAAGQGLALHVYKYKRFSPNRLYIATAILILLAITFTAFTFYPPHIPAFKDSLTLKYGI